MKNTGKKLVRGFLVCLLCGLMGNAISLHAAEQMVKKISLEDIKQDKDWGKSAVFSYGEDCLNVEITTEEEKKGYYTTFFFTEKKETLEEGNVLSYHISTQKSVRMNVNVILRGKKEAFAIEDGEQILLKHDSSGKYVKRSVRYGTFQIPKNFSGTVYVPITSKKKLHAEGFGFITVLKQKQTRAYTIGDMRITSQYTMDKKLFQEQFFLKVGKELEIPRSGEYYYMQDIRLLNAPGVKLNCDYELEETVPGVTLKDNGKLWVKGNAKEGTFYIRAKVNGILVYRYKITLKKSELGLNSENDSESIGIPHAESVKTLEAGVSIPYQWIRLVLFLLAAVYLIFYNCVIKRKG